MELVRADNGIGMNEATVEQLFTPFSQADGIDHPALRRHRAGLAISECWSTADGRQHPGRHRAGRGTTFTVRLRRREVDAPPVDETKRCWPGCAAASWAASAARRRLRRLSERWRARQPRARAGHGGSPGRVGCGRGVAAAAERSRPQRRALRASPARRAATCCVGSARAQRRNPRLMPRARVTLDGDSCHGEPCCARWRWPPAATRPGDGR